MNEPSAIDRAVLDGLLASLGGDHEFLAELMQDYFSDSLEQLASMEEAIAVGDAEALRRAAHSLKSNSNTFGAITLSRLCKDLEDLGKEGELEGASGKFPLVQAEYGRARAALQAM